MSISLEAISSIGSMMSGLAVLGSLVYLSLQVKQAEKNQQAIIQQTRSTRNAEFNATWRSNWPMSLCRAARERRRRAYFLLEVAVRLSMLRFSGYYYLVSRNR